LQEKLSKLKYKFKTEVKSGKSGYMLYAAVLAGILCIAVLKTGGKEQSQTQTIVRPDYTDSADNIELEVLAEGEEKPFLVELEVSPRQYDAQQIEGIFDTVYEQILQEMVSGNESLSCVRQNLKLVTESQDYPVTAEWYSEDTAVIDTDGTVYNTEFEPGQKETVRLVLILKYGEYRCEYPIEAVVWEAQYDTAEQKQTGIVNVLTQLEKNSQEEVLTLPDTIHGMKVTYQSSPVQKSGILGLCGLLLVPLLLSFRKKEQKMQAEKRRKEQLTYDYAEVISKLVLLAGAGMTIRRAWEKIAGDYQQKPCGGKRYVYEEMVRTCAEMNTGIPERSAYERFARRCDTKEYLKLASLLSQNVKKGTTDILKLLEQESQSAFEQHKNLAKKKGEEAGTKLLFPMILMLMTVMAMLMFPAIVSFQTF
jgi:tight adherence protein C